METYRRLEDLVVNYIDFVGAQFSEPDIELPQPVGGTPPKWIPQFPIKKWASEENGEPSVMSFTRFAHFIIGYSFLDIGCSLSHAPIHLAASRQREN